MYIEIIGTKGRPIKEVTVKFHEGVLHNKEYTISTSVFIGLFHGIKLPIGNLNATVLNSLMQDRIVGFETEDESKFYNELIKAT